MALLIRGKYLLTDPGLGEDGLLDNAAVVVEGDEVIEVGPYDQVKAEYPEAEVIGSGEELILPGFIDGHSHGWGLTPLQAGSGYNYLEKWVLDLALNTNIDPYLNACYSAIKHLESGCTTMHHYHNSKNPQKAEEEIEQVIRGYNDVGIRFAFSLGVRDQNRFTYDDENFVQTLPADLGKNVAAAMNVDQTAVKAEYFALFDAIYKKYNSDGCKVFFGPMAPQWCSDDLLGEIRDKAESLGGVKIHMHVLQTILQKAYSLRKYGKSLVSHLNDIGLAAPNITYGHAIWLTGEDLELMAATDTSVTHHASCNFNMRNGIQPVAALRSAGVRVAIGLDDKGINDDEDYIQEMRLIQKLHRVSGFDFSTPALSAFDVIQMGTVNAAHVIGFSDSLGKLEKGRKADMSLIDLEKITGPWLDPRISIMEAFIHRAKGTDVKTVIVGGKVVLKNGKLLGIDKRELFEEIAASASKGLTEEQKMAGAFMEKLKPYVFDFYADWYEQELEPYYIFNSKI